MVGRWYKKGLVFGIVFLFIGVSVTPSTGKIDTSKTIVYNGSLLGYVNDTSGSPIEEALVRVYFHGTYEEDYSDSTGFYDVTNIPICRCLKYTTCSKENYKTKRVLLGIVENTTHDFILTPDEETLEYDSELEDNNEIKQETAVRIHRANRVIPYTLKLTEKESDEIDRIFENIKVSLDSAETDEEIDEIYDDAVVSLYELGLFPKSITVEEAQELVNGKSQNQNVRNFSDNLGTGDENFNCQIVGRTTETFMFDLANKFRNKILEFFRFYY